MKVSHALRTLFALVLSLLLPLQAGATLARATAMALHAGAPVGPMTVAPPLDQDRALDQLAHGAHAGHAVHADHAADGGHGSDVDLDADARHDTDTVHGTYGTHGESADGKPVSHKASPDKATADKPTSHYAKHAKAGCADCAKCCLHAASAPPPMLPAVFVPMVVRASFTVQHAPIPAFLTDGPERPPRHLIP